MSELSSQDETLQLRRHLAEMHALVRVIGRINQSLDLEEVLRTSLGGVQQALGGGFGCLLLLDPDTATAGLYKADQLPPALQADLLRLTQDSLFFRSMFEQAGQAARLCLKERIVQILARHSAESAALIPLTAHGRLSGILLVAHETGHVLTPLSMDLLMSMGEQIGRAIEHARLHASLRESEEWHRLFIENSPNGFLEGDAQGNITYVNDSACTILEYARAEILGMPAFNLLADPKGAEVARQELGRSGVMRGYSARVRVKSGAIKIICATTRLIRDQQGNVARYQTIFHDVTEHQQVLEVLRRRNQELNTINAIADILNHPLEIPRSLDRVCEHIASVTGMEGVALYLLDDSAQMLNLVAHRQVPLILLEQAHQLGLDDLMTRRIAVEGQVLALADLLEDNPPGLAGPKEAGYHAGIGVPIRRRGVPVGAIFVGSQTRFQYEKSDIALLLHIGDRIGMALENADLYAQMQRRVGELDGLARFSTACASSLDLGTICELAVDWTRRLLRVDVCAMCLVEGSRMRLSAARGFPSDLGMDQGSQLDEALAYLLNQEIWVVEDIAADVRLSAGHREWLTAQGLCSALVMPLRGREHIIGLLATGRTEPHSWSQQEVDLLRTIANEAANAIANAQLFQTVLSEQRKVRAIFDSGLSGLFATDGEGRIVMFNRAAERITGWPVDKVLGKKWEHVFADSSAEAAVEPLIYAALRRKQSAYVPDGRKIQTRDGRIIPIAKAVAPLVDEDGAVTGAVGAFWDLTREKAAELSREGFLRMAAHQMRNPLTVLLVALELLENPRLSKERREEMRELIKSQSDRLRKFSQQFLELETATRSSRPVRFEPLPIVDIVRRLVREFQVTHRDHRFRAECCHPEPFVYADADRVDHILHNLLDNAVNYSPPKSLVRASVSVRKADNLVDVAIRDEGCGIALEEQQHLFDMFYRANRAGERRAYGHGLGLYIARKLAQEMDGTIEFESPEGDGCVFHLLLRRCQ